MELNLEIRTAADAVTYAAPLLGFTPTNSIVIYVLSGDDTPHLIELIMRLDVTTSFSAAAHVPDIAPAAAHPPAGAILLGIADEPLQQRTRQLLDIVRDALHHAGTPVLRRILTHNVTEYGTWTDPDTGETGPTLPHNDSILSVVYPRPADDYAAVAAEFHATQPPAPAVDITDTTTLLSDILCELGAAIADPRRATPQLAAQAGLLITCDVNLRDRLIRASTTAPADAARLWTSLARPLRGEARAQVLTIAALAHHMAGDGPRAGLAVQAAVDTVAAAGIPMPRLTRYAEMALHLGISPETVRTTLAKAPGDS